MLRVLWILFWVVIVVTGITVLGGFFTTDEVTSKCSDGLINCLTRASHLSWGSKIVSGLECVYTNALCVFKQIGALF